MKPETLNLLILLIKTGGVAAFLWFFIVLIRLVIRYWPKHNNRIEHVSGSSFKHSENYGLFEAIFHAIRWVFRWNKINTSTLVKIMEKLNELSVKNETKSSNIDKDKIENDSDEGTSLIPGQGNNTKE